MNMKIKSNKQEKKVAKEVSGRVQIASGSIWCLKGDVRNDELLIECKTTEKSYYPLNTVTWEKIRKEALNDGFRIPIMCIDLLDGKYRKAVIDLHDFYYKMNFRDKDYKVSGNKFSKSRRISFDDSEVFFHLNKRVLCIIDWEDFLYVIE